MGKSWPGGGKRVAARASKINDNLIIRATASARMSPAAAAEIKSRLESSLHEAGSDAYSRLRLAPAEHGV
jgi:hypothetical protein